MVKAEFHQKLLDELEIEPFKQRFPWFGGDLQTLRDTFIDENLYLYDNELVQIEIPSKWSKNPKKEHLIAFLNLPLKTLKVKGLILLLHGLGGSSRRRGLRRMTAALLDSGFAVLRLNLRGASPGRQFAAGTYAANCNSDIFPAIEKAREISCLLGSSGNTTNQALPVFGVGISLGGTILLNACLDFASLTGSMALDALACISTPLDLSECSASIERPRNSLYQTWLLNRLVQQTLEDPFGVTEIEREFLVQRNFWNIPVASSIKAFDAAITAPRWGFKSVDDYYRTASPLNRLLFNTLEKMPKTLLIHSLDDPWVPAESAKNLFENIQIRNLSSKLEILLTKKGGHNGFHGLNGCWGDEVVKSWLMKLVS
ncbi:MULTISPECIES: alpha/beta fold hydrolase [Prochlorococcus]|uniref:Alpha/beta superfamily hydrolase n=1 Tax=Prochlorococcus marinus (strain SARG / CCMP1375 / SS120) TaxID=167539 RepID=Q7VB60_PROMA|nr:MULTISPECIES: alpha/beta fold hydrolase [Prochlorococcus]AAQ00283.1 Alpha/beta superfamily hydrolase [Prochlorococcus marinus subsp. marinus str. CCMP1375]KGG14094.1 Alpha/beta hydrolase [Prochlorococcus marinus str. LG]KGG20738.1 Alpha/beta hydrolase [Prochlorococcus marinus str. SS2]KGG25139.1 Alpha/beta hydrolase [Prochlorococcus marinus str. SS35]KGG33309.1 Alpha/beta hydrolase [Prochlorococcus marinus str. SS51]